MKIRIHRKGWRQLWKKTKKFEVVSNGTVLYLSTKAACERFIKIKSKNR